MSRFLSINNTFLQCYLLIRFKWYNESEVIMMKIGISGLGSLGLVVGGILTDKNYDVTFIDSPQGNNKKIINELGVKILGYSEQTIPCKCLLPEEINEPFDIIFSLTKLMQLKSSLSQLEPCINNSTTIVTCQNGIPEDEALTIIPENQLISCSIAWGATRLDYGISKITSPPEKMDMVIGTLNGVTNNKLNCVKNILEHIGKVEISNNIKGIKWTKLIMNSNFMGPCGVLGCKLGDVLLNKDLVKYVPYIALEGAKVCNALGIKPETLQGFTPYVSVLDFSTPQEREILVDNIFNKVWGKLINIKPSLVQDLEKGKKTEIDYINGKIVQEGKKLGIPTPVNECMVNLIKDIEESKLPLSVENAYILESLLPQCK